MYYTIIVIIILLLILMAIAFNNSKNKKIKIIGLGILILAILVFGILKIDAVILFNPVFIVIYITIIFGIFLIGYKKCRNIKYQKESNEEVNFLNREISTEYPPSIVGYLINNKIRYKDLIADIMELYAEKIINISNSNKQDEKKIEFYLQDKEYRNKINSKSYIYIINTLINDTKNAKFDFGTWKQLVLEEYELRKFANPKNNNTYKKIIFITILLMAIVGGSIGFIAGIKAGTIIFPTFLGLMLGSMIGVLVGYQLINFVKSSENTNVFLSKYGKNELKKWMKFKKFIKEYTLLKDRKMEEIAIYESYIPYAIALDVNIQYKNTKFDIFDESEFQSIIDESDCINFLQSMGINI